MRKKVKNKMRKKVKNKMRKKVKNKKTKYNVEQYMINNQ